MYALADCNNFFVSCERLFRPALWGKPVLVLSGNDGCVVSRSNEAKALGIGMGVPVHQVKDLIEKHNVIKCSSNFALYGDISHRVMYVLAQMTPQIEIYSIDEAFLNLEKIGHGNWGLFCSEVRERVGKDLGMPISVGIGATKTLAKAANYLAKKKKELSCFDGVVELVNDAGIEKGLDAMPIGEVWGVGSRYAKKLQAKGIETALQLRNADLMWVRREMTIMGERLVRELRGQRCAGLAQKIKLNKQLIRSRSFGKPVQSLTGLEQAISSYASRACVKLREQGLVVGMVRVFIQTNPFNKKEKQYFNSATIKLGIPTADTRVVVEKSLESLRKIYKPGYRYKKAGVVMDQLKKADTIAEQLFEKGDNAKSKNLMGVMDKVNQTMGGNILHVGTMGVKQEWIAKPETCSGRFTTSWNELLEVNC